MAAKEISVKKYAGFAERSFQKTEHGVARPLWDRNE
jgi:hypothetical protein